jgi:hypothetical protein
VGVRSIVNQVAATAALEDADDINHRLDALDRALAYTSRSPRPLIADLLGIAESIYSWLTMAERTPNGDLDRATRLRAYDRTVQFDARWGRTLTQVLDDAETVYAFTVAGPESRIPVRLVLYSTHPDEQGSPVPVQKGDSVVAVQMQDTEQFTVTVEAVDSRGNPVAGDSLTWTVDNTEAVAINVDPSNPMRATIVAGRPGNAIITVSDGTLSGQELVTVTAGAAVAFSLTEGAVEAQPAAAGAPAAGGAPDAGGAPAAGGAPDAGGAPATDTAGGAPDAGAGGAPDAGGTANV